METVIIVIHLMVIVALIAVVLLQRSEGGALGIGGGGGGNFMSTRGQTNVLTRTTAILAAAFFATSIALTILSRYQAGPASILDNVEPTPAPISTEDTGGGAGGSGSGTSGPGILDELQAITPVPTGESDAPATDPASPQVPTD
ncbi:MAG: preprotein translocase subunit SecG [Bauldia litoralis]|uniref:preprotein translocase subunit SecG n=1 Tax=Bauldia litoralis TaxID=665467 RepID=UPI003297B36D